MPPLTPMCRYEPSSGTARAGIRAEPRCYSTYQDVSPTVADTTGAFCHVSYVTPGLAGSGGTSNPVLISSSFESRGGCSSPKQMHRCLVLLAFAAMSAPSVSLVCLSRGAAQLATGHQTPSTPNRPEHFASLSKYFVSLPTSAWLISRLLLPFPAQP